VANVIVTQPPVTSTNPAITTTERIITTTEPPIITVEPPVISELHEWEIGDALEILKHLAGLTILTEEQMTFFDIDNDGEINISDALEILKYLASLPSILD